MKQYPYERPIVTEILNGLNRKKKLLHIIIGPRQVGKTTAALQIADGWLGPVIHASADSPLPPEPAWIHAQWELAGIEAERVKSDNRDVLLILDELQKVRGWSEVVKLLWDRTCVNDLSMQVIILGSSSLLIQKGLSESLAGLFFLYRCPHWTLSVAANFLQKLRGWL